MQNQFLRSPISYVGCKYALLLPIFKAFGPHTYNRFIDVFSGSATVAVNMNDAKQIICNDGSKPLTLLYSTMQQLSYEDIRAALEVYVGHFRMENGNKAGFLELRTLYNSDPERHILALLILVVCAFNGNVHFSGMRLTSTAGDGGFTKYRYDCIRKFHRRLVGKNITITNQLFQDIDYGTFGKGDAVYADPPYRIASVEYCRGWTDEHECSLYDILDRLDAQGAKWVLSNAMELNGRTNNILKDWATDRYRVYDLKISYDNCTPHRRNLGRTREILVAN